jgi:hypothetical protein
LIHQFAIAANCWGVGFMAAIVAEHSCKVNCTRPVPERSTPPSTSASVYHVDVGMMGVQP